MISLHPHYLVDARTASLRLTMQFYCAFGAGAMPALGWEAECRLFDKMRLKLAFSHERF
jgi:hypothetical protein